VRGLPAIARLAGGALVAVFMQITGPAQAFGQSSECLSANAEAQRFRFNGKLISAWEQLRVCAQPECTAIIANECHAWVVELEAAIPSVIFAVSDGSHRKLTDVRISSGGVPLTEQADGQPVWLDPGVHRFQFEADGYHTLTTTLEIKRAEKSRRVSVQLQPTTTTAPRPAEASSEALAAPGIPTASYVLSGVALAGFGAFAYFALTGSAEYQRLEEDCAPACTAEQVSGGKRAYVAADIALGVGIASAATALVVYLTQPGPELAAPPARARLSPGLLRGGAFLQWSERY
jgi:hypothetical protein